MHMECGMLADEIDDRYARPECVVQVRHPIGEARAQMQKSARRFIRHPGVAVCCPSGYAFKKPENAAHSREMVEGRDHVNL